MKRYLLLTAVSLAMVLAAEAQDPELDPLLNPETQVEFKPDTVFRRTNQGFTLPDSLSHLSPWRIDFLPMNTARAQPKISMTSVIEIQRENLPSRVTVIDNNTLRLGPHFNVSNGQAWNWSPDPDAYLDARTLSFPMR